MAKGSPLVKPYLKWAGGKRQLLPEITKYIPARINEYTYYEPFLGAGALLFHLQPKRAVINDFNEQLMLTYLVIKDNIDLLIKTLNSHKEQNSEGHFYEIRAKDREPDDFKKLSDVERAARLIYLNKTCYNGLYRVNSQGLFNVPYGNYKKPAICEESVLRAISKYLNENEITIISGDFTDAVKNAGKHSFVYFDPPYHSPDNTNFTGYQADKFDENEQERLCNVFRELTERGSKCLLSNSDTEFIRELYNDIRYEIISVVAKRPINSDAAGRGNVKEVLIKNWR